MIGLRPLLAVALAAIVLVATARSGASQGAEAPSDLDALMARVLAHRDHDWQKLQQYVLNERETFQLLGGDGRLLYGSRREYFWFPREGRFIKSPLSADGVVIGDDERVRAERRWLDREARREQRRTEAQRAHRSDSSLATLSVGPAGIDAALEPAMRDALEPGFVSAAYFLKFKFDAGQYAFVGRETYEGREVLRIEYYPTLMFREGRTRPNREIRQRHRDVERQLNKSSLATLWITPADHQIVRYEFTNIDMDFLATPLVKPAGWTVAMEMGRPLPDAWLPRTIRIEFDLETAVGGLAARYLADYYDYRLASVTSRVRP